MGADGPSWRVDSPMRRLSIFPDGDIFQYHDVFVQQALGFLR
jgi:hypothetical protein